MPPDAAQPPAQPPAGPELARSVADDLGPIFAAHGAEPAAGEARESRVRAFGPAARRRAAPISALGAVLAATVAGLSIGTALAHRTGHAPQTATAQAARVAGPPIVVAQGPAPTPLPIVRPVPAPQAASAPVVAPALPKLHRVNTPRRHPPVRKVTAHVSGCGGLDRYDRAWCGHRAVMEADDRLRRAYDNAVRAGVSRPVLVGYRERWSRLRSRAGYAPGEVVAGYSMMAADLSRMAERRRRAGVHHAERWWGWG